MMRLPKNVVIGYKTYKIKGVDKQESLRLSCDGECDHESGVIKVLSEALPYEIADTLLHEILHGVYAAYNIKGKDKEERTVRTITHGLAQVWRDNPVLIEFLNECWKRK